MDFPIEKLTHNEGLVHLVPLIFSFLDDKTYINCRLVSKAWRALIENDKRLWIILIDRYKRRNWHLLIEEFYPVMDHFKTKAPLGKLQAFTKCLIDFGNYTDSPMHYAASEDRVDFLELLLDTPTHLNMIGFRGYTPFGWALKTNCIQTAKFFLNNRERVNLDVKNTSSEDVYVTFEPHPIVAAAYNRFPEIVELLLQYEDFDPNEKYQDGSSQWTALHYATYRHDHKIVDILLSSPKVNAKTPGKVLDTALHHAASIPMIETYLKHSKLRNDIDFNIRGKEGMTPLHEQCYCDNDDAVEIYMRESSAKGIDFNAKDDNGKTPLHSLCHDFFGFWTTHFRGHYEGICSDLCYEHDTCKTMKLFLNNIEKFGIDINAKDNLGRTPLHYLCMHQCAKKAQMIIDYAKEKGLKIIFEDHEGKTPMDLGMENKRCKAMKDIVEQLNVLE